MKYRFIPRPVIMVARRPFTSRTEARWRVRLSVLALTLSLSVTAALANRYKDCNHTTDPDRRIQGCTQIIERGKKEPAKNIAAAYNNRGAAYSAKGEHDRAIADLTKVIALNPKGASAYLNRGNAYSRKGEYDLAIADYEKAIALNPKEAKAYLNRGATYHKRGELDRAIADYDKAIALNPKAPDAYSNRGTAYGCAGDLDRAIADHDKAITLDRKHVNAYSGRGFAYLKKGDKGKAIADFRKALEVNPSYLDAKIALEAMDATSPTAPKGEIIAFQCKNKIHYLQTNDTVETVNYVNFDVTQKRVRESAKEFHGPWVPARFSADTVSWEYSIAENEKVTGKSSSTFNLATGIGVQVVADTRIPYKMDKTCKRVPVGQD